ncbi:MAG TPA: DUF4080 domain-containing protein [Kiritimatiellia bacterium]|nr:DUF4080 domain-containing protein [Kiritimatiellia bacterium]
MADIVLATINARYSHASFGLRYLLANLGELKSRAELLEFDLKTPVAAMTDAIAAHAPRIIGLGVYIWNAGPSHALLAALRVRCPDAVLVLGGPEVSHEAEQQEICARADYVVQDEGDLAFPALCEKLLAGERPPERIVRGGFVDVRRLALPYAFYTEADIAHRVIYVEASRGCPFTCEFCLSSLDVPVRRFPLETLLPAFEDLLARGVRHFKFVDRTFNLSIKYSLELLAFFLQRHEPGLFLHFEMIPDRLPPELREILACFPRGALQFEVGIQTFNEEVAARIKRRQDYAKTEENMRWLIAHTGAYLHADLIAGLPGEDYASFGRGFDRLLALGPQEIQVNVLKRLRGTPIVRHDAEFRMRYNAEPPYDLIENRDLDAASVAALHRFGRFWDLYVNSGNYQETAPRVWADAESPFAAFDAFSRWLHDRWGRAHGISIDSAAEALFDWLVRERRAPPVETAEALWRDLCRTVPRNRPAFLKDYVSTGETRARRAVHLRGLARQARRL